MSDEKLDSIERRQIRMENDIKALIEQVGTLIERGADLADARFPSIQQKLDRHAARSVAATA